MSRRKQQPRPPRRWQALAPASAVAKSPAEILTLIAHWRRVKPDVSEAVSKDVIWKNDRYQVNVRRLEGGGPGGSAVVHLSVRRLDRAPVRDWRDMQRIKNQLLGPEVRSG